MDNPGSAILEIYQQGSLILINKPLGWTSYDVVRKIQNLTRAKVGHAGTLDPLATGLLICCTGSFTKQIRTYQSKVKEYTGSFTLGAVTPTFDLESAPEHFNPLDNITREQIGETARQFLGEQLQIPPAHSAIKMNGNPIYKLARKGIEVNPVSRPINILEFEITHIQWPVLGFRVVCSTGTYIRSLANDFGKALGCGAYLSSLCRTRIGEYLLEQAVTIEAFADQLKQQISADQKG